MTTLVFGAGGMSKAFADTIRIPQDECDVRDIAQVADTVSVYNPDVVIMTAGVSNPGPIESARFEEEIGTNLLGAFNVAQICVNYGVNKMIFIASVAGLHGKPNHSAYSASKAGVISLVQSLAHEGYGAWAISPGRVDTEMRTRDYPNDTPGSRLSPFRVWEVIRKITNGDYPSGSNIMVRKIGLDKVVEEVVPTPYRDILAVGQPVTI